MGSPSFGRHTNDAITFTSAEVSDYFAARVPKLKPARGGERRGPCPIHKGKDDNFAVDPQTGQWFCHSTCGRGGDILELEMALTSCDFPTCKSAVFRLVGRIEPEYRRNSSRKNGSAANLSASKPTRGGAWREVARYRYVDRAGNLLFEVVRYLLPHGDKIFIPERPSGVEVVGTTDPRQAVPRGGVVVGLKAGCYVLDSKKERARGIPIWRERRDGAGGQEYHFRDCPRVPYRLPNLLTAETVYLPEGEKDVHTLEAWGLVASCNPGGSGSTRVYEEWLDYFKEKHIVIPFDNDRAGHKHALEKAEYLLDVAASIRILELPGLPDKGDITDWRDAGGTFEQFRELVEAAVPVNAAALYELRVRWGLAEEEPRQQEHAESAGDWPKPEPLQGELPPVQAFSEDLLPDSFRPLVADITERMQVPMDYPAGMMVLCLAGAVNRRAVIQPKALDTRWVVVPNLWGGIIAPPGFMKSPVIQAATRPLEEIQTTWRSEYEDGLKDYTREKEEFELRRAAWKEEFKAASKKAGRPVPERPEDEPSAPTLRRLIVNDATFEALHQTMSENPGGILVIRDELTGWLSQLDRVGREGERAFYLQAWNGDTGHTIDRIGRGTIHVPHCCASMLGGIQPARLRSYLVDALTDGPSNDGLIQRFQVLVWPDTAPDWNYVDRPPAEEAEQQATRVFRKLVEMGAEDPARFRFTPDAQELFVEWLAKLEAKIRGYEGAAP